MHEFHQQHRFTNRWTKNHPIKQVIGDPSKPVTTRSRLYTDAEMCMYALTLSTIEPTNIKESMVDHNWIELMQDELNQFKRLDVWELVERPSDRNVIKPDGFVDPGFPNHVYRLKKALYGLKQAPRAWYDKFSSFLIDHHFTKGIVDPTLFTRRHEDDILLVQIYVDDIYFGSTNLVFLNIFAKLMKDNFKMSMMGEMKFFLGLQDCTAMSIGEAEYVSLSACCAQVIWIRTQLLDYGYRYTKIPMYCNSKSANAYPVIRTEYQLADLFTKALPKERFEYLVHRIEWDAWVDDIVIDEDEVIPEDETPELIKEFQNDDKRVPTIVDHERMEATLRDM
ncbi:retrotransposon protein, putative, unclassified [Tanacetum coccineum]